MKGLVVLVLTLAAAHTAAAADIRAYEMQVRVASSGNAEADAKVRLEGASTTVAVPIGFPGVTDLQLTDAPSGTTIAAEPSGTQTLMRIVFSGVPSSPVSLSFSFRTGNLLLGGGDNRGAPRMLRHALLNSQPEDITAYTVRVLLPPGLRAHAVREALPKLGSTESGPRVELVRADDVNGAVLRSRHLAQGSSTSMQLEMAQVSRSPVWLVAGLLLSVAYLVSFRDLVVAPSTSEARVP